MEQSPYEKIQETVDQPTNETTGESKSEPSDLSSVPDGVQEETAQHEKAPRRGNSFFAVLYMTTQRPEMGNGGLYSFAYIYLTGNPVVGEALIRRGLLALVGYFICGAILFAKHRKQHKTTRFSEVIRKFDLSNPLHL